MVSLLWIISIVIGVLVGMKLASFVWGIITSLPGIAWMFLIVGVIAFVWLR